MLLHRSASIRIRRTKHQNAQRPIGRCASVFISLLFTALSQMVGKIRYYSSIDPAVLEILTLEYNAVAGHQLAHIGQLDLRAKDRLGARIHDYLAAYDRDGAAPADYIIVGIAAVGINAVARPLRYIDVCLAINRLLFR